MKKGDIVEITEEELPYFRKGDKAKLSYKDSDGHWWGNFHNMENDAVCPDGIWCITQIGKCRVLQGMGDST